MKYLKIIITFFSVLIFYALYEIISSLFFFKSIDFNLIKDVCVVSMVLFILFFLVSIIKIKKNIPEDGKKILLFFAEGKITVYEFWDEYNSNKCLRDLIYNDMQMPLKDGPFGLDNININLLSHRCIIFNVVKRYFQKRKILVEFYNRDIEVYAELLNICPKYIDFCSEWFNDNILTNCPYDIHTEERKVYIMNKVKESYKFETNPPRWLKEPEWPIDNNGPLLFIKQDGYVNSYNSHNIKYVFFNEESNKNIIIEQWN